MEKTNNEIYNKMIDSFNIVLSETFQLRQDTTEIIDKNNPNYLNIRRALETCYEIQEKVNNIDNRIKNIENLLEQLMEK